MKQRTRRLMALMLTASMAATGVAVPVAAADDPYKQAEEASDATDAIGGIVPSADAKYTISVTEDGWIKVEN